MRISLLFALAAMFAGVSKSDDVFVDPAHLVSFRPSQFSVDKSKNSDTLNFEFEIAKGYHIQSNPPSQPNLVKSELSFGPSKPRLQFGSPQYPSGQNFEMMGGLGTIRVYEGRVKIPVRVSGLKAIKESSVTVAGTFRYQICDDKTCLFPVSIPVGAKIVRQ